MKHLFARIAVSVLSVAAVTGGLRAAPPTAADVGDAETFGHNAQYMGATSGFVTMSTDPCPAPTPTPSPAPNGDSFCDQLNAAPTQTNFNHENICRIKLPKKATRNVIYPVLNVFLDYLLDNSTGVDQPQAVLSFTAGITIESDALSAANDPTCIDPGTGLQCNGKISFLFNYNYRDERNIRDGDHHRLRETLVRAGNTGLTKQQFQDAFGLSAATTDALFKGPMTVRMDIRGSAKMVSFANITCNMRLFGD